MRTGPRPGSPPAHGKAAAASSLCCPGCALRPGITDKFQGRKQPGSLTETVVTSVPSLCDAGSTTLQHPSNCLRLRRQAFPSVEAHSTQEKQGALATWTEGASVMVAPLSPGGEQVCRWIPRVRCGAARGLCGLGEGAGRGSGTWAQWGASTWATLCLRQWDFGEGSVWKCWVGQKVCLVLSIKPKTDFSCSPITLLIWVSGACQLSPAIGFQCVEAGALLNILQCMRQPHGRGLSGRNVSSTRNFANHSDTFTQSQHLLHTRHTSASVFPYEKFINSVKIFFNTCDVTAATVESHKSVVHEVKDSQLLVEPSFGKN